MSKIMRKSFTNNNRSGKTPCPKGISCPYKDEYQHSLEFCHNSNQVSEEKQERSNLSVPFSGTGKRLGGERVDSVKSRNVENVRSSFLHTYESSLGDGSKKRKLEIDSSTSSRPVNVAGNGVEKHSNSRTEKEENSSSSSLKLQQDREYEESLLREILLSSVEEETIRVRKQQEQIAAESELLKKAQDASIKSIQYEKHQRAKLQLKCEPNQATTADDIVTIRFVLPSSVKVSRRFCVNNSVKDVFTYLRTIDELIDPAHLQLRSMMNNELLIDEFAIDSFRDFKIVANCSLIVLPTEMMEVMDAKKVLKPSNPSMKATVVPHHQECITIDLT